MIQCSLFRRVCYQPLVTQKCYKKKIHWSVLEKKNFPVDKALQHFDDFYKSVFRLRWPSIRLALLSPHKYVCLINNFGDTETTTARLEMEGAINIKKLFELEKERSNEKKRKENREKELQKVFDLEKTLGDRSYNLELEETGQIYPKKEALFHAPKRKKHEKEKEKQSKVTAATPLSHSLDEAEMDLNRVIDPDNAIEASALYDFIPATKLKGLEDYIPESQHYSYYKTDSTDFPINIEEQKDLNFPENLKIYSFPRGSISEFEPPKRGFADVFNYYLLDGASVLPVIALGIKPGDYVLDMCAAPGGKSLTALQTLYPKTIVCNDTSLSRSKRMRFMFRDYIYNYEEWSDKLIFRNVDGTGFDDGNVFDKILVDVPCTNDRHSLQENDNNIFSQHRIKERLLIPEIQSSLLTNALKLVRNGGSVVYSTCSLSPIQNDGVVHMALRHCWEDTRKEFVVRNLSSALACTSQFYRYSTGSGVKFGHLVVPFLPINFGPLYFCRIDRIK